MRMFNGDHSVERANYQNALTVFYQLIMGMGGFYQPPAYNGEGWGVGEPLIL